MGNDFERHSLWPSVVYKKPIHMVFGDYILNFNH